MLECRFESQLRLEFLGFSTLHFLKLIIMGFLHVHQFPPLLHLHMDSAKEIKAKSMPLELSSPFLAHGAQHVALDTMYLI